ncbi:MAG: hypothetical protein J4F47_04645 [Alphaproteobacteria bacterium]|nr:hypothetical protein [Alphaproteobacteria bacterium]
MPIVTVVTLRPLNPAPAGAVATATVKRSARRAEGVIKQGPSSVPTAAEPCLRCIKDDGWQNRFASR